MLVAVVADLRRPSNDEADGVFTEDGDSASAAA